HSTTLSISTRLHHFFTILSTFFFFFFTDTPPPEIYTLSLHDALPIWRNIQIGHAQVDRAADDLLRLRRRSPLAAQRRHPKPDERSEEHTSELQSRFDLVCRLLLEKKKKIKKT